MLQSTEHFPAGSSVTYRVPQAESTSTSLATMWPCSGSASQQVPWLHLGYQNLSGQGHSGKLHPDCTVPKAWALASLLSLHKFPFGIEPLLLAESCEEAWGFASTPLKQWLPTCQGIPRDLSPCQASSRAKTPSTPQWRL